MSRITTHILDTSSGIPADGVEAVLYQKSGAGWKEIASGVTNSNGRISDLLPDSIELEDDIYKMKFETGKYFDKKGLDNFYPYVEIIFRISGGSHYHIPLLISPYGYTTYRGS